MKALVVLTVLASLLPAPAYASRADLALDVLSSRPDQVTGGDAPLRVRHRGTRPRRSGPG
ncbi:hypothetical protein [Nonomuraea angiospora]